MKFKFKVGDKIKILDGRNIKDYTGSWVAGMSKYVGKIATISEQVKCKGTPSYYLEEFSYRWDERGLEPLNHNETIVIYRKGNETIALDKSTGKKAVAKCSPDDTFDFNVGAKLALERLIEPQPLNTKICIVKSIHDEFTVGKIYEIKNGVIEDNECNTWPAWSSPRFYSIEDVKAYFGKDKYLCHFDIDNPIEFVEVIE